MKTVTVGKQVWVLPFNAHGFYINDARGTYFAECRSQALAKDTAKLLNVFYDQNRDKNNA